MRRRRSPDDRRPARKRVALDVRARIRLRRDLIAETAEAGGVSLILESAPVGPLDGIWQRVAILQPPRGRREDRVTKRATQVEVLRTAVRNPSPATTTNNNSSQLMVASLALDTLALVVAPPIDQVRTLYRTLLVYAAVSILILIAGLAEFFYFEPPGQQTGLKVTVVGVYQYDPDTGQLTGPDSPSFPRTVQFAAKVDWSTLPPDVVVDARWFDSFGGLVGSVGPGTRQELASKTMVPVKVPAGLHHNLPGHYIFVVERYDGGLPVEVLARRVVLVEPT